MDCVNGFGADRNRPTENPPHTWLSRTDAADIPKIGKLFVSPTRGGDGTPGPGGPPGPHSRSGFRSGLNALLCEWPGDMT
ncbi:hypothetical protein GCM10009550_37150 [Actinocorallia libanotica]|uniref:Uncharacterized protein n=1 Tax=Actinocorallia libanotica TaxID=46162 RepID=A0ABN1RAU0_9ACTN